MRRFALLLLSIALAAGAARAEEDMSACYEGSAAQTAGEHDLAIAYYNQCIEWGDLAPANLAIVLYNRATSHQILGDYARALRDYSESIRVDPQKASAYNGRCWVYGLLRRPEEALEDCNESLRLVPDEPYTLDSRALAYWLIGDLDKAQADLERARALNPTFPRWEDRFRTFEEMY